MHIYVLFYLLAMIRSESSDDNCSDYDDKKCEGCLGLGNGICGWCYKGNTCMNITYGRENCKENFVETFDMECHISSLEPISTGARIGIAVFSLTVAVVTFVFWVFVFPVITRPKAETNVND